MSEQVLSPNIKDFSKTATLTLPAAREYFSLPSITRARKTPPRHFEETAPSSIWKNRLPFVDFSNSQVAQAGQYWPGATASTGAITAPPSNTLPTPPTIETEFKPPGQSREGSYNATNVGVHQSGMASNIEPPGAGSSLTSRRPAATNLPNFELPPPQQLTHKFQTYPNLNTSCINNQPPQSSVSVGNLLTPPPTIPGDILSPISSGVNNASPAGANSLPPYNTPNYWPGPGTGTTPYSMGSGNTPQPWGSSPLSSFPPPRGMFSPSLNSLIRNSTNSPSVSDSLPPPPPSQYDMAPLPPFSSSLSANLPAVVNQHAAAQAYLNSQTPVSASASHSSVNSSDSYIQRSLTNPPYYSNSHPSSAPQQAQFPAFPNSSSPVQQSPMSASTSGSRISPISGHPSSLQSPSSQQGQQGHRYIPPYSNAYSLPAMNGPSMMGPILSNVHNPGSQMALIGGMPNGLPSTMMPGFNSGHSAQMQQLYGGPQQAPHHERPFKCDQCPQSFNRNHDLKRHKRIHLAVKPFPCGHCEKSFSRKDALKVRCLIIL